jgi:hypothetical protein
MTRLEAHGTFAAGGVRPDLPCTVFVSGQDVWCATATALASLSGWLEDARTVMELKDALEHGCALVRSEIVGGRKVRREVARVIAEVLDYGRRAEARVIDVYMD